MRKYNNQDPETPKGQAILVVHFISQASPSIRQKLQKLEQGPQTPFPALLDTAFKVFNNREEASRNRRERREEEKLKRHAQYMALAIAQSLPKQTHASPSPVSETTAELLPVRSAGAQSQERPTNRYPVPLLSPKGPVEDKLSLPPSSREANAATTQHSGHFGSQPPGPRSRPIAPVGGN